MNISRRQFLYGGSALAAVATTGLLPTGAEGGTGMNENKPPLLMRKADALPPEEIVAWLKALRGHPYVAQSGFDVTAVFRIATPEGVYHIGGVNVENRELTAGTCGEEGVIAAAVTAFGQRIDIVEGWLMGAPSGAATSDIACYPCGECRQRIAQYAAPDAPFHVIALDGRELDVKTRGELLPNAFSFRDLPDDGEASPVSPPAAVAEAESRLHRKPQQVLTHEQVFGWLRGLRSDVRVSRYNEMTVWRLANGAYVAGVKVENAAYPSSTNVMSAAAAVMHTLYGRQRVEEVWAYGFRSDAAQAADAYYQPSGASLQVLHQFVTGAEVRLHHFDGAGKMRSSALKDLLSIAPVFG